MRLNACELTEAKELEFRVDVVNVLNQPNFGYPVTNINSTSFGQITTATGSRRFAFNARVKLLKKVAANYAN